MGCLCLCAIAVLTSLAPKRSHVFVELCVRLDTGEQQAGPSTGAADDNTDTLESNKLAVTVGSGRVKDIVVTCPRRNLVSDCIFMQRDCLLLSCIIT